jgi:hypothetical protein
MRIADVHHELSLQAMWRAYRASDLATQNLVEINAAVEPDLLMDHPSSFGGSATAHRAPSKLVGALLPALPCCRGERTQKIGLGITGPLP